MRSEERGAKSQGARENTTDLSSFLHVNPFQTISRAVSLQFSPRVRPRNGEQRSRNQEKIPQIFLPFSTTSLQSSSNNPPPGPSPVLAPCPSSPRSPDFGLRNMQFTVDTFTSCSSFASRVQ